MRSTTLVVLALVPLTGCDWGFVSPFSSWGDGNDGWWGDTGGYYGEEYFRSTDGMDQVSSLWNTAEGIAFTEDGSMGAASMYSVNCSFRTSTGSIENEDQEPTEDDEIQDGNDDGSALLVAVTATNTIRITRYSDMGGQTQGTFSVPGVQDVRFDGDDVVWGAQNSGCRVGWTGSDLQVQVGTLCGGFDASNNGTVVTAADGSVKVVTTSGDVDDLGIPGELVAWDYVHDQIYSALVGGDTVTAIRPSGSVRWTATLDGRITTLTDMGDRGAALVGLETDDGARVVVLDGATGNEIAYGEANEAPSALWASPDGSTFAARVTYNTHFVHLDE